MAGDTVQIDCMQLNISGLTREEAERIGQAVTGILSRRVPAGLPGKRWAQLDVRVQIPQGTPKNRLPELIAEHIWKSLQ